MRLRSFLRDWVPPAILHGVVSLLHRARGMGFHTFEGNYRTLSDVPCGDFSYDDDTLAKLIATHRLENLRLAGGNVPTVDNTGHTILPLIVATYGDAPLTVLDFGGGAATALSYMLDHLVMFDPARLSYIVVETPAMVRAVHREIGPILERRFGDSRFVQIREDIPGELGGSVIVHIGGTIQYLASYAEILAKLTSLAPDYVIVGQTPMTDAGPTYARQQLNMPKRRLATWVFNRQEFLRLMKSLNYQPVFMIDHDLPLTHKGAPGPSHMVSTVFRPVSKAKEQTPQ